MKANGEQGGDAEAGEVAVRAAECPVRRYPSAEPRSLGLDPALTEIASSGGTARLQYPYGDPCWVVTSYDDARAVYSKKSFSRSGMAQDSAPRLTAGVLLQGGIGSLDDDTHLKLRRAISRELNVDRVESLRAGAETIMADLLARIEVAGGGDYVAEVSKPFSLGVLGELLEIPVADQSDLAGWVGALLSDASVSDEAARNVEAAVKGLGRYVVKLVESRQAEPGDDLVSGLLVNGSELDKWEVVTLVFSVIVGGFESTALMLSKMVFQLIRRPDLWATLHDEPSQVPKAVDELLRLISLAGGEGIPWMVTENVRLGGVEMSAGDYVMPAVGAANRDPLVFEDPDEIVLGRTAKPHLGFGHGLHYCLGSQVARMELEVGLGMLVEKYSNVQLACGLEDVRWDGESAVWQLEELPIEIVVPAGTAGAFVSASSTDGMASR